MDLSIVILAAGQGKRMKSELPKGLHRLGGKPILQHIVDVAVSLSPQSIFIVHGHKGFLLQEQITGPIVWVEQPTQQGTADAVRCALPHLSDNTQVLILLGDVPLISHNTLADFRKRAPIQGVGVLTAILQNPQGLGRIIRDAQGQVTQIVEEKDATEAQKKICEINTGIFLVPAHLLKKWLPTLNNHNAQKEFYLTDICELAVEARVPVVGVHTTSVIETQGVNDLQQLVFLERFYQRQLADQLLLEGVYIADPDRLDIRGQLTADADVKIDINVLLEGKVHLGKGAYIGPHCVLKDCQIGVGARIEAFSHCEGSIVEAGAVVGPFARLRSGTHLKQNVKVGNFVEIKKSTLGEGSKAGHLSYLGDAIIGQHVNVGAGTITCNFDGASKHLTIIEDGAFIGSNTALVAPVTVGAGATIGAGTVLTKDAPAEKLTLSRIPQQTMAAWRRRKTQKTNKPSKEGDDI